MFPGTINLGLYYEVLSNFRYKKGKKKHWAISIFKTNFKTALLPPVNYHLFSTFVVNSPSLEFIEVFILVKNNNTFCVIYNTPDVTSCLYIPPVALHDDSSCSRCHCVYVAPHPSHYT